MRASFEERFWSRVDKNGPVPEHKPELGQCWIWTGATGSYGYGNTYRAGKYVNSHRVAFELCVGPADDSFVLHKCDNPSCCNPGHLFLGTQKANMVDMATKGRQSLQKNVSSRSFGDNNGTRTHPETRKRGSGHHASKLTEATVLAARAAVDSGETMASVARRLGVSKPTMRRVILRRSWAHV